MRKMQLVQESRRMVAEMCSDQLCNNTLDAFCCATRRVRKKEHIVEVLRAVLSAAYRQGHHDGAYATPARQRR